MAARAGHQQTVFYTDGPLTGVLLRLDVAAAGYRRMGGSGDVRWRALMSCMLGFHLTARAQRCSSLAMDTGTKDCSRTKRTGRGRSRPADGVTHRLHTQSHAPSLCRLPLELRSASQCTLHNSIRTPLGSHDPPGDLASARSAQPLSRGHTKGSRTTARPRSSADLARLGSDDGVCQPGGPAY